MQKIPFYNIANQHQPIATELEQTLLRVLNSGWYIHGQEVAAFEKEFAAYMGVKHAIGVGNGLDALVLILKALGIGPGDEVIVPSHTFIATWLAVSQVGAKPVPVLTNDFFTLAPDQLAQAITSKTKAIIPVHLYGHPADMDAIADVVGVRPIWIIEDAAQAHGATYKGKKAGNLSVAAGFSFYPGKNLGALGDGGGITTNDDALANKIRCLGNYGSTKKYYHELMGTNSRLDELQAAVLRVKLPHLDAWNARRQAIAEHYMQELADCAAILLPVVAADVVPVWHQFVIQSKVRDALQKHLAEHGIDTIIHYPVANHLQGAYAGFYDKNAYVSYQYLTTAILSLPMCPTLTQPQVQYVCDVINSFL